MFQLATSYLTALSAAASRILNIKPVRMHPALWKRLLNLLVWQIKPLRRLLKLLKLGLEMSIKMLKDSSEPPFSKKKKKN